MAQQPTSQQKYARLRRRKTAGLTTAAVLCLGTSLSVAGVAAATEPDRGQDRQENAAAARSQADRPDKEKSGPGAENRKAGGKGAAEDAGKAGKDAQKPGKDAPKAGKDGARAGDNGTVKIHQVGTAQADRRNQPHVCGFYLDAFGFDPSQAVAWTISQQAPTKGTAALTATMRLDARGAGRTGVMTLPAGHYKLTWRIAGANGQGKHKVFWVDCDGKKDNGGKKEDDAKGGGKKDDAKGEGKKDDAKGEGKKDDVKGAQAGAEAEQSSPEVEAAVPPSDDEKPGGKGDSLALTGAQKSSGALGAGVLLLGLGGALLAISGRLNAFWRRG
jgi:hypothetical protein